MPLFPALRPWFGRPFKVLLPCLLGEKKRHVNKADFACCEISSSKSYCRMLDLTSLQLFVRAAELGSLSQTAKQSNLALAAVSRRLALLESQYGIALLTRNGRGVAVTPAGAVLLSRAHAIFREVNLAASDVSDYANGVIGSVTLQASTSAVAQFLPADLARFGEACPNIRLNIREAYSAQIINEIRNGEAEVGVILEAPCLAGLRIWKYRRDRLAVVVRRDFRPELEATRFVDLIGEDLVQMGYNTAMTRLLAKAADQAGAALRLRVEVDSFDAVCRMIQAGFGIGVLPRDAANNLVDKMDLRLIELEDAWAERQMYLCANSNIEFSGAALRLIEFLVEMAANS